jgi:hypothetical protein
MPLRGCFKESDPWVTPCAYFLQGLKGGPSLAFILFLTY